MALLGELTYALLAAPQTVIGTLIPHVIVEETYRDEVIITDHPVERGAAITDHAFVRPSQIEIRCGWSNSTAGSEGYIDFVYQQMLTLLRKREPFDVYTPRRQYTSMLIQGIQVTRDERTNSVLNCSISLREIIIAQTQTSGGSAQSNQTDPQTTASVTDQGTKQTTGEQTFSGPAYDTSSPFNPGSNTSFLGDGSNALGSSGGLAGFDEITFINPAAPNFPTTIEGPGMIAGGSVDPSKLEGNIGQFGNYAPGAFGRSTTAPF